MQAAKIEQWDPKLIPTLIELLLDEKLGSAWESTARDLITFGGTLSARQPTICGPYEIVHWWSIGTIALRDSAKDITRFVVYGEFGEPEAVLELDSSQTKPRFIVVYRASDKYPEEGSFLQTR